MIKIIVLNIKLWIVSSLWIGVSHSRKSLGIVGKFICTMSGRLELNFLEKWPFYKVSLVTNTSHRKNTHNIDNNFLSIYYNKIIERLWGSEPILAVLQYKANSW